MGSVYSRSSPRSGCIAAPRARAPSCSARCNFPFQLLTILSIASVVGTVVSQTEPFNAYLSQLGRFRFPIFEKRGSYSAYNTGWFVVSPLQEVPFSITPCTSSFEDGCSRLAITAHSLLPGRPGEGVMRIAIDEGRQIGTWSADRARMLEPAQRNALIERFAARRFPKKRARNPCARHWMSMRPYANMFLTGLHSSGAL